MRWDGTPEVLIRVDCRGMKVRGLLLSIVIVVLASLFSGSGVVVGARLNAVQQSAIALTVHAGFGDEGGYVIGEWFPVRVTLNNPAGGASMRARVEIDLNDDSLKTTYGIYAREVDLPSPSRKEVTLYAYSLGYRRSVEVRLMQGSSRVASAQSGLTPYEQPANVIIAVASSDSSLLNVLSGEEVAHAEISSQA